MAVDTLKESRGFIEETFTGREPALDDIADLVQKPIRNAFRATGPFKDLLHGVWLRHPLHSALTDVPIGAWWTAFFLDLLGWRRAADDAVGLGILAAVPTALSGAADWSEADPGRQRRLGVVHALLNVTGLCFFIGSWFARRAGNRGTGVALSTTGLALVSGSAWIGGELVYPLGMGVSRNAFEPEVEKFTAVARIDDVPEGILWKSEVDLDGQKIPLVLLRRGDRVMALSAVCSHWGGPLNEGKLLEGDVVQCPWHKSQFKMSDGTVCGGPASMSQPTFETRIEEGWIRVRRKD